MKQIERKHFDIGDTVICINDKAYNHRTNDYSGRRLAPLRVGDTFKVTDLSDDLLIILTSLKNNKRYVYYSFRFDLAGHMFEQLKIM